MQMCAPDKITFFGVHCNHLKDIVYICGVLYVDIICGILCGVLYVVYYMWCFICGVLYVMYYM